MPPVSKIASPELAIALDRPQHYFAAGDTIAGHVTRNVQTAAGKATVKIQLFGRAKVLIKIRHGEGQNCYRSRFQFFGNETQQTLYSGLVQTTSNDAALAWSFSMKVPDGLNAEEVRRGGDQKYSYLDLSGSAIHKLSLPSDFYTQGHTLGKNFAAYVEYWLEAEFRDDFAKSKPTTATLPIAIRTSSTPDFLADFGTKSFTQSGHVLTPRLLPGQENAQLSLLQKTQKLFRSSSLPQFGYTLELELPTLLQLDNPRPIPIKLRILHDLEHTSEDVAATKQPPRISLTSLAVSIEAGTNVIAPGRALCSPAVDHKRKYELKATDFFPPIASVESIAIPLGEDEGPLDVTEQLHVLVAADSAQGSGRESSKCSLSPSFTIFNIKHTHQLQLKLVINVAGESVTHREFHGIELLGPSVEQKK